jgi:hypothetical protein
MPFASLPEMMTHMKNTIKAEWTVTNLREPKKIVGIQITNSNGSIDISQQKYIKSLLHWEGMAEVNMVGILLDPQIKLT